MITLLLIVIAVFLLVLILANDKARDVMAGLFGIAGALLFVAIIGFLIYIAVRS